MSGIRNILCCIYNWFCKLFGLGSGCQSRSSASSPRPVEKKVELIDQQADHEDAETSEVIDETETDSTPDDLTTISGIGPVIEKKLHNLGITTFRQIAELDEEKIAEINEQLSFKGRIEREKWVEQAKDLIS